MPTLARSILVAWAAAGYLCVAGMIVRSWRRIGYCPVTLFKYPRPLETAGAAGLFSYPLLMIAATYVPEAPLFWRLQALHRGGVHAGGAVLLALGIVLYVVSVWTLGTSWRIGVDPQAQGPLVTSGVYSLIRHPIYASVVLDLMGGFLTYASVFSAAAVVLGIPALLLVGQREEEFLLERFGDAYRRYVDGTGRLFPRISKKGV